MQRYIEANLKISFTSRSSLASEMNNCTVLLNNISSQVPFSPNIIYSKHFYSVEKCYLVAFC